jgi:hypothetical protein
MRLVKTQNFNSENFHSKIVNHHSENAENCEMHLMPVRGMAIMKIAV